MARRIRDWPAIRAVQGSLVVVCALADFCFGSAARGAEPQALDRADVGRLASERAPDVHVAEARAAEARAFRTGAATPNNPELAAYAGPRWDRGETSTDFFVGLVVPIDVSGALAQRSRVADERAKAAESDAEAVRRRAVADALGLWVQSRGAVERVRIEQSRLELDRTLLRAAEARREAGTVGDGDVALARVLVAQGVARQATAERALEASLDHLRADLGMSGGTSITVEGPLESGEPAPLDVLLPRWSRQPVATRALAAVDAAHGEQSLQHRAGIPVPRFTAGTGRDPGFYVHAGLEVPIPVFQRNQQAIAVADAQVRTTSAEYKAVIDVGEADLRAAYAEYEGAREALRALQEATPAVDDAERLAARAYELGQSTLTDVTASRREAAAARSALLDAQVAAAHARIVLDAMTGTLP